MLQLVKDFLPEDVTRYTPLAAKRKGVCHETPTGALRLKNYCQE